MERFVTVDVTLANRDAGAQLPLPDAEVGHLEKVLRMERGTSIVVTDGHGWSAPARFEGAVAELADLADFQARSRPSLTVLHALPKGRKLDEVVRFLTELGVDRIVPVESAHSVVRLRDERSQRAAERWRAVAVSAANQSRRVWRCEVEAPRPFHEVVADRRPWKGLVAAVGAGRSVAAGMDATGATADELVLAVGPEGGWSDDEVAMLSDAGLVPVGLGPTVLRTEHAAGVLVAIVSFVLGRLD